MRIAEENGAFVVFCDDCGSRVAWVKGDVLIIKRKHHGDAHVTVIPIGALLKLNNPDDVRKLVKAIS